MVSQEIRLFKILNFNYMCHASMRIKIGIPRNPQKCQVSKMLSCDSILGRWKQELQRKLVSKISRINELSV